MHHADDDLPVGRPVLDERDESDHQGRDPEGDASDDGHDRDGIEGDERRGQTSDRDRPADQESPYDTEVLDELVQSGCHDEDPDRGQRSLEQTELGEDQGYPESVRSAGELVHEGKHPVDDVEDQGSELGHGRRSR